MAWRWHEQIHQIAPKLPLVLFSSLGRKEAGDTEGHFSAYLAKPLRQSQLFDTLVSLLARKTPRRRSKTPPSPSSTPAWPSATRCASCWPKTTW
jgi:two-component SAPR family response regulator